MKYIKYLLLSIPFFLISITDVDAASIVDYSKMSFSQDVYYINCRSNDNCWNYVGDSVHNTSSKNNNTISSWKSPSLNTVASSSGIGMTIFSDTGFVSGNVYTISILVDSPSAATANTSNTKKVGVGNSRYNAYINATNIIDFGTFNNVSVNFYGDVVNDFGFSYLSYTFKATSTGNYIFLTMTTLSNDSGSWYLYGYTVTDHGSQSPSTNDIKNALNSNFIDINNNINNIQNNINDVNDNINNVNDNINDMKENIDNTLNSDDDDVNSSKCGIVCKLKNIVSGIVNLPSKIWEKLKVGFELITGAIGDFCDSIINIFIPEPECNKSSNLITYDLNYQFGPNSITYEVLDDGGIKFNGVCGTLGVTTTASCTFRFNLEESNFDGTLSFYANKKVQRGYISAGNISIDMAVFTLGSYLTGSSYGTINRSFYDIILNAGYDFTGLVIYPQIEKDNVDNNNKTDNSWFTKPGEVCTEASFFSWFERFGQIIKGFFDTLLGGILDGLKSLFVPTDEQLLDIIDKSKQLSENFGFVGQSVNFFLNIFTSLLGLVNANGCVQLPEMTIGATSLFDSHTFWNSQLVCLNDNKILADNIETIRTITSIALVCMFVNFASRKFFEVLSKNETPEQAQNVGGVYR